MSQNDFYVKCWELLKQIPKGKVTTYGEIARTLDSKAYRAVGRAMNQNPNPIIVPCHRVISSDGSLGGYAYGLDRKVELLRSEGVVIQNEKVDLREFLYQFSI